MKRYRLGMQNLQPWRKLGGGTMLFSSNSEQTKQSDVDGRWARRQGERIDNKVNGWHEINKFEASVSYCVDIRR